MHPLRSRAAQIAAELRELQKQLASAEYTPQQVVQDQATLELIRELKLAVDAMRQILWKYIDSSAAACPTKTSAQLLSDATALLRSLGSHNVPTQPVSFIDVVSAFVEQHPSSKSAA